MTKWDTYKPLAMDLVQSIGYGQWKVVSIFLHKNKIVSFGVNKNKTHPMMRKMGYNKSSYVDTIHAELDGYLKCIKLNKNFDSILIYRGINCNLASEPCIHCAGWLRNIKKLNIEFLDKNLKYKKVRSSELNGHTKITGEAS